MTRLLQAMSGQAQGGAEAFFERLAIGLRRAGEDQSIVIRRDPGRAARLRHAGLAPVELPFGGWLDFRTKPMFRRIIESFGPSVVLTWMSRATSACPSGDFVHVARLGGYYDLKYYRGCDHLVGNTRDIVAWLVRSGWPADRAHYLPNFAAAERAEPVSRASLDTPEDAPLALALGRLHRNKGFDLLIAAMASVPRLHLWLAGAGEERAALERQARQRGVTARVHFLGWRDDVPGLLAAADFLVCPSRHEPLGNVVIEAWAAAKPVLATSSEGPRVLVEDGVTGLLVPIESADGLAGAMTRLAGDAALRSDLGAAGYAAYEDEFAEARVVALYRDFLARVQR